MGKTFIKIGNTQIKKTNIKSFGTATEPPPPPPSDGAYEPPESLGWTLTKLAVSLVVKDPKPLPDKKFLFVTTYQEDNYRFYEDEIDIDAALKMLEEI